MRQEILTSTFINLRKQLQKFAARFVGNNEAEDVVHDAFIKLWMHHPDVRDHISAKKLVYTSVRNSAIDNIRYKDSHPSNLTESNDELISNTQLLNEDEKNIDPDPDIIRKTVIELSMKVLNERQREVFRLHDLSGWDYDEIATYLQISQENVRMILSRARKAIREIYKLQDIFQDEK